MDEEKKSVPYANYTYRPVPPAPKTYFSLTGREYVFAALGLILSILGVSLSIWGGFMAGFTVSYVLFFALITAYLAGKDTKLRFYPLLCAVLALAGSGVFTVGDYFGVNFWMVILLFALTAVWVDSLRGERKEKSDLGWIRRIFAGTFGAAFRNLGKTIRSVFRRGNGRTGNVGKVIAGMACAIPVLLVIVPILIRSDAAFQGLVNNLFTDFTTVLAKTLLGVWFAMQLVSYGYSHRLGEGCREKENPFRGIEGVFVTSFLGAISLCYLAYLFSQLAYFFSGFAGILPEDFHAADYARRGFFEMFAIAVINLLILFGALALSRKKEGKAPVSVRIVCVFICLFTLVIVATALSKMVMYIHRFGLTRLRIGTSAAMIALAVTFAAMIVKCFTPRMPVSKIALVTCACILLALGYGNVDKVVAEYNITAYRNGTLSSLDVRAIGELGTASVPYLLDLTQDKNEKIAAAAQEQLSGQIFRIYDYRDGEFRRPKDELGKWNLPLSRAYAVLDEYVAEKSEDLILRYYGLDPALIFGKTAREIQDQYGSFQVFNGTQSGYFLGTTVDCLGNDSEEYLQICFRQENDREVAYAVQFFSDSESR